MSLQGSDDQSSGLVAPAPGAPLCPSVLLGDNVVRALTSEQMTAWAEAVLTSREERGFETNPEAFCSQISLLISG